jgi:hypothetical protein
MISETSISKCVSMWYELNCRQIIIIYVCIQYISTHKWLCQKQNVSVYGVTSSTASPFQCRIRLPVTQLYWLHRSCRIPELCCLNWNPTCLSFLHTNTRTRTRKRAHTHTHTHTHTYIQTHTRRSLLWYISVTENGLKSTTNWLLFYSGFI